MRSRLRVVRFSSLFFQYLLMIDYNPKGTSTYVRVHLFFFSNPIESHLTYYDSCTHYYLLLNQHFIAEQSVQDTVKLEFEPRGYLEFINSSEVVVARSPNLGRFTYTNNKELIFWALSHSGF
jgi:hypothetical protein